MSKEIVIQADCFFEVKDTADAEILAKQIEEALSGFNCTKTNVELKVKPMWRVVMKIDDSDSFVFHEIVELPFPAKKDETTFYSIEEAQEYFKAHKFKTETQAEADYYTQLEAEEG